MIRPHERLGLLLGFLGRRLFAGTLPATRPALAGFDPLFLTVARAALVGSAGLVVILLSGCAWHGAELLRTHRRIAAGHAAPILF